MDMGHDVIFSGLKARVVNRDGDVRFVVDRRGDLYYICEDVKCTKAAIARSVSNCWSDTTGWVI